VRLIVPRPEEENRLLAFIGPFQPMVIYLISMLLLYYYCFMEVFIFQVWLFIFISLFFVVGTMTFFTWLYKRLHWNNLVVAIVDAESNDGARVNNPVRGITDIFSSHMIYVINIMTNQGRDRIIFGYDLLWFQLNVSVTLDTF
jgi:ionotropic glutamate receptor